MSRIARVGCALLLGCGGTSTPSEDDTTTAATTSTSDTSATGSVSMSSGADETASTSTTTSGATTEVDDSTGPGLCTMPYPWGAGPGKDVLVVVMPGVVTAGLDVDALHALAAATASADGTHIAVAAEPTGGEPPDGNGYEALALPAGTDPVEVAVALTPSAGFLRPHVPLRVVVVTDVDTSWDAAMVAASGGLVTHAQIDARAQVADIADCDALTGLTTLAAATEASWACQVVLTPADILDTIVLADQPACTLAPEGPVPTLDGPGVAVGLHGVNMLGPRSDFPPGPVDCATTVLGWTILDAAAGTLGLCPATCGTTSDWYLDAELYAEVTAPCQ